MIFVQSLDRGLQTTSIDIMAPYVDCTMHNQSWAVHRAFDGQSSRAPVVYRPAIVSAATSAAQHDNAALFTFTLLSFVGNTFRFKCQLYLPEKVECSASVTANFSCFSLHCPLFPWELYFLGIQTTGNINSNWLTRKVHKMTEHV